MLTHFRFVSISLALFSIAGSSLFADEPTATPSPYYLQDGVQVFPGEPASNARPDAATKRLDAILERLTAIEERLSRIEADQFIFRGWTVDGNGVMRLPSGRPIGFWGIDGGSKMDVR